MSPFETLGKPSVALQKMVDGLRTQSQRTNFLVTMGSYGCCDGKMCYGCAATCAIQATTGIDYPSDKPFTGPDERAEIQKIAKEDLQLFEMAIENARSGGLLKLFVFYGVGEKHNEEKHDDNFKLSTEDWAYGLPAVDQLISELQAEGL